MIAVNPQYRERDLLHAILLRYGSDPRCRLWRNQTGTLKSGERYVRFGLVGSADILGLTATGRFLAIECKASKGRQTEQQRRFQDMVLSFNGLYVLARSVEDVEAVL